MLATVAEQTSHAVIAWGVIFSVVGAAIIAALGWTIRQMISWAKRTDRKLEDLSKKMSDSSSGWQEIMNKITWEVASSRERIKSLEADRDRFHPRHASPDH